MSVKFFDLLPFRMNSGLKSFRVAKELPNSRHCGGVVNAFDSNFASAK